MRTVCRFVFFQHEIEPMDQTCKHHVIVQCFTPVFKFLFATAPYNQSHIKTYLLIILSARCLPCLIQTWQLQHCVKTIIIAVCLVSTSSLYHSELKSFSCSSWSLVGANVLLDKLQKNIKLTDFGLCTEMNVSTLFSVKWCLLSLLEHKNVCYRCVHYGITGEMCGHIDINNYCSNMVIKL